MVMVIKFPLERISEKNGGIIYVKLSEVFSVKYQRNLPSAHIELQKQGTNLL